MVFQCKKCRKGDIPLFILPMDPSLRLEWCVRLGLNLRDADENRSNMRICADHFEPSCIYTVNNRSVLTSGSIPKTELVSLIFIYLTPFFKVFLSHNA
jgi:hypothetical protein